MFFFIFRYFEKLVYVMIDIDPQAASQPQLQATIKALPGVLEVWGGYRLSPYDAEERLVSITPL